MGIKFGTDGWRAIISQDFTFENVRVASQAVADHFKAKDAVFVIGYDWRFLSEKYAELAAKSIVSPADLAVSIISGAISLVFK